VSSNPVGDFQAQFRPTVPNLRPSAFVEQKLTSTDQTISNYAQAMRALPSVVAVRSVSAFVHAFSTAMQEAGNAMAQWNTDDNPKLMSEMLLACGQANAVLFDLDCQLHGGQRPDDESNVRRSRRMSAIMVGPRLLGLTFAFTRLFEHTEMSELMAQMVPDSKSRYWGPASPMAANIAGLRRELDDAALSPIEAHQLKAGAADGNGAVVTMLVGAMDAAEGKR
jgi:hypothetical protein